jgi:hypothetical protein
MLIVKHRTEQEKKRRGEERAEKQERTKKRM